MCTGLTITKGNFYLARNLDINYYFGQRVVVVPRKYPFKYRCDKTNDNHYAIIGMGIQMNDHLLFADAMNEKGLGMAELNFKGFAKYPDGQVEGKNSITCYEIISWILQNHETVKQVKETLKNTILVNIPLMEGLPCAPVHWIIADKDESIVLEQTEDGLKVHDNPVGVLTNNPPFEYHMMSLRDYRGISTENGPSTLLKGIDLPPLGVGMGGIGLPGDSSPNSRFVKAAFLRSHAAWSDDAEENIALIFHILDNVAMVKGTVMGNDGKDEYTYYTSCINGTTGDYIYKTHKHRNTVTFNLFDEDLDGDKLIDKGYLDC